jgi:tetratricopeptide (TPR) repeat protein
VYDGTLNSSQVDADDALAVLNPERRVVPYNVLHHSLRRQVVRWVDGTGSIAESVLCVSGTPGSGKTRLLVEIAAGVTTRCGWVRPGRGVAAAIAAAAMDGPVLLLVDDGDTRTDLADLLTTWSDAANDDVRVIVAARSAGPWWQIVRDGLPSHVLAKLPYRPQVTIPPIVGDPDNQQQVFAQAMRYFAPAGTSNPAAILEPTSPAPSILLVHATAALAVYSQIHGVVSVATAADELFAAERKRWQSTAARADLGGLAWSVLDQVVVLAALVGAADRVHAEQLLRCLPALSEPGPRDLPARVADWLRGLYAQQIPDWLAPHLPAVLVEQFAARVVATDRALVTSLVAATTGDDDPAYRLVTTLARAMEHTEDATTAMAALLHADPIRMIKIAVHVAITTGLPLDGVVAATVAHAAITADQFKHALGLIPPTAAVHLLADTAVTLFRCYLADDTVNADRPGTIKVRSDLADMLQRQGRYDQAEVEYRTVLTTQTQVLGADHPDTLRTRHDLGGILQDQGRDDQAETEFRAVLATRTRVLGADDRDTLRTRYALADVLHDRGHYDQAEAEYRDLLATQTRLFGADHPDTLETRQAFADVLDHRGRFDQAETEFRAVLATRTRVLGTDHLDTLSSRRYLANVLVSQGRYDQAEAEYRAVLDIQTRVIGPDHPRTLATRLNLAGAIFHRGRYHKAEVEYRAVLDAQNRVLGSDHPAILVTRQNFAAVLAQQGRYDQAEGEYRYLLPIATRVFGADHPSTLSARHNLAKVLDHQGHFDQAEAEYRVVLATQTRLFGADHPDTLNTRHNLANVLDHEGHHDQAEAEYRAVLDIQSRVLGPDHPDTLSTRRELIHGRWPALGQDS